jgi:glycosyltransferase involved in cell wall biosynthesis
MFPIDKNALVVADGYRPKGGPAMPGGCRSSIDFCFLVSGARNRGAGMFQIIEADFPFWIRLAVLVGLQWLLRLVMLTIERRQRFVLRSDSHPTPPESAPHLSMLVAAKDEQDNIEACVTSLLAQDYPNLEIIVIDDRSDDQTPKILKRLRKESDGRLRVISILDLEEGWFGKNNAMREGVAASSGAWLCFTDADCWQISTKTLSIAMQEALTHDVDLLTVTPVLEMNTLWEKLIQPACVQTLMFWFQPRRVNNPAKPTAYANGAFMLMRRSCYETIGGHERVKTEVNEDIQMARLVKAAGLTLRMAENDDLYRARMYGSIGELWRGWSRILFGSLKSAWRLGFSICASGLFTVLPPLFLILSLIGRAQSESNVAVNWNWMLAAWGAAVLACQASAWQFYSFLKVGRLWSLTYVCGAVVVMGMLINALLKQFGMATTTWRGTTYLRDQMVDVPARGEARGARSEE